MSADRDVVRVDEMLDEVAQRVDELGLDPGWGPFVVDARGLNAGEGLASGPPIT